MNKDEKPINPAFLSMHSPALKIRFQRLRYPFLFVSVAAMAFAVISTLFLPLEMRFIGIGAFSVLIIVTFLLYNPARSEYDKWKHLDLLRLREGSDSDLELEIEFHNAFREEGGKIMEDIEKARRASDVVELGQQAHKLKGSALTIGYPEIAATTTKMEALCKDSKLQPALKLIPRLHAQMIFIDRLMTEYFTIRSKMVQNESKKER